MKKEQIETFLQKTAQKSEFENEKQRIDAFLARPVDNRDTQKATKGDLIFVKFAGTGCYLSRKIFDKELAKRKTEIDTEITTLDNEINNL